MCLSFGTFSYTLSASNDFCICKYTWKRFIDHIKCDIRKMQFVITFRKKKFTLLIGKKNYRITQIIFMEITFLPNLNVPHITYKKFFF
jgi:hypothetical protein